MMLRQALRESARLVDQVLAEHPPALEVQETGTVIRVSNSVASVRGLGRVQAEELIRFPGGVLGIAFNLDADEVGVILLGNAERVKAGDEVQRSGRVVDVPVGEKLLGRVIDATGRPVDGLGPIHTRERWPVERSAPAIMDREPVNVPLATGIKVIDALIPIGRGQRELILGDRQTGKTAIALDAIVNQKDKDLICVYCAIGQRDSAVAKLVAALNEHEAMTYTIVVVAAGEDPPGLQYITPYAATSVAEYFMERGNDVLIVYDDLTRHARAYRELSLLLRRPPGREAYPGDIFYVHSRLLERATHMRKDLGGGSLTALPILETEAQNLSAYIPTNLISITDGQIYLSPDLFRKGMLPAVDVGKSVSRVGGKAQLPAYRSVSGPLKLSYSQFEELEVFARFGTRLDEATRNTIEHGLRVREILKQAQYQPLEAFEQVVVLLAVTEGLFDHLPLDRIQHAARDVLRAACEKLGELRNQIHAGEPLTDDRRRRVVEIAKASIAH